MTATKAPTWYPIECEHGYDCCPICDAEWLRSQSVKPTAVSLDKTTKADKRPDYRAITRSIVGR